MLDFIPQSTEELKKRFPEALKAAYDAKKVAAQKLERPGEKREHVFDFEDGVRIVISRDFAEGVEYIHFSGSVDNELYKGPTHYGFFQEVICRFNILSNYVYNRSIRFAGISAKGIPHFLVPYSTLN